MAALNTGIILHRLTVSLHIRLKLLPGNVEAERDGEIGGKVVEELIMTRLCFHTRRLLSQRRCFWPQTGSRFRFCSFTQPLTSSSALSSSLRSFCPSALAGRGSFQEEKALICSLFLPFFSLFG